MRATYINPNEQEAFQEGYNLAISELRNQFLDSKTKILNLMFDTEPYTSQRRMLLACERLLAIYDRHYEKKQAVAVEPEPAF